MLRVLGFTVLMTLMLVSAHAADLLVATQCRTTESVGARSGSAAPLCLPDWYLRAGGLPRDLGTLIGSIGRY
jgi:hypothetical protein